MKSDSPATHVIKLSTVVTLLGLIGVILLMPSLTDRYHGEFARRWDGGCHGWGHGMALWHAVNNALHWWAYIIIALALLYLHPTRKSDPQSGQTLLWMFGFVMFCAGGHLINVLTNFYPIYRVQAIYDSVSGTVSMIASLRIAFALQAVFRRAKRNEIEVEKKLAELESFRVRMVPISSNPQALGA